MEELGLTEEELELLEPHPDIHALFVHYNDLFFESKLGACSVEWSSARMTLCGGVCEFRPGGGCRIKLSEPLLKLRPSRDLKMVLLHEMIHAYMMLQGIRDDDAGGHGTIFKGIMGRINASTLPDHQRPRGGYNITTTHSMFAEVDHYRQHHWRCKRCGEVIKRAMNRRPQEADCRLRVRGRDCGDKYCGYHMHQKHCGGEWVKIKEPEGFSDKQQKKKKGGGSKADGSSASSGAQQGSGSGSTARPDGVPLPAKRPKKGPGGGGLGAGARPITDFFPSTAPASPTLPPASAPVGRGAVAAGGSSGAGRPGADMDGGSAEGPAGPNRSIPGSSSSAGSFDGRGGGSVLPAIEAVVAGSAAAAATAAAPTGERGSRDSAGGPHKSQDEQQQAQQEGAQQAIQEQQQRQAEPSAAERRQLLAEAALRRLGRGAHPSSRQQPQQPQQQPRPQQQAQQQPRPQQQAQQQPWPQQQAQQQAQPQESVQQELLQLHSPPLKQHAQQAPPPRQQQVRQPPAQQAQQQQGFARPAAAASLGCPAQAARQAAPVEAPPRSSCEVVDLADSTDEEAEDGKLLPLQSLGQAHLHQSRGGTGPAAAAVAAVGAVGKWSQLPAAAAPANTSSGIGASAAGRREGGAAGAAGPGTAVACPICGRQWRAAELSNAELNAHIDACLISQAVG